MGDGFGAVRWRCQLRKKRTSATTARTPPAAPRAMQTICHWTSIVVGRTTVCVQLCSVVAQMRQEQQVMRWFHRRRSLRFAVVLAASVLAAATCAACAARRSS